jgi:hypothetical protein
MKPLIALKNNLRNTRVVIFSFFSNFSIIRDDKGIVRRPLVYRISLLYFAFFVGIGNGSQSWLHKKFVIVVIDICFVGYPGDRMCDPDIEIVKSIRICLSRRTE